MDGLAAKKALAAGATCNIAGFFSGYTGKGASTILPASAIVKLDFRLVPNMDPKKQEGRLRSHLRDGGFGDIGVSIFHVEAAARTDPSDPFVADVRAAADEAFGGHTLNISSAGTGAHVPVYGTSRGPVRRCGVHARLFAHTLPQRVRQGGPSQGHGQVHLPHNVEFRGRARRSLNPERDNAKMYAASLETMPMAPARRSGRWSSSVDTSSSKK